MLNLIWLKISESESFILQDDNDGWKSQVFKESTANNKTVTKLDSWVGVPFNSDIEYICDYDKIKECISLYPDFTC